MKVLLHIGQHKTGSTALQSTLREDRDRLIEHGILYPEIGHLRPFPNFLAAAHNGLFFGLIERQGGPDHWETLDEMRDRLAAQVAEHDPHTVLISSERAFMVADQGPDAVLGRLDETVPGDKEVVAYLRRPDRFLSSYHRQLIEMGRRGLGPLHEPERLAALQRTFQLDYVRALRPYDERYGPVTLHHYEAAGDTIDHFYTTVLGIEPPEFRPDRTNPSTPLVLSNLALGHLLSVGALDRLQAQALVAHRERERVDLLGPDNRRQLLEWFEPRNIELGRRVGRDRFFEDLQDMVEIPDSWLSVAEADERYRGIFAALVQPVDVGTVRRDCMILENAGQIDAASALYAARSGFLSPEDRSWFREDLEAVSGGEWTIRNGVYAGPPEPPPPPPPPPSDIERIARGVRRRLGGVRRRLGTARHLLAESVARRR